MRPSNGLEQQRQNGARMRGEVSLHWSQRRLPKSCGCPHPTQLEG